MKSEAEAPACISLENYRFEESVGYLIKRVRTAMAAAVDRELASLDMSHEQSSILFLISTGRAGTAAELAREAVCDTSSMTRMIDRLEAKGLVERHRSSDDRRIVHVAITEAGRELAAQLPAVMVSVLRRHLAGFSDDEVQTLRSLLRRMVDNCGECLARARDGAAPGEKES